MGTFLHRGMVDVGFLGALEVDQFGNSNTTEIRNPDGSVRRFNGSGGANDMASSAKRTIVIARHEARKLVPVLSHLTSPGFLRGGGSREAGGLRGEGPSRVLTDKAVLGFDPEGRMRVVSIHPGVTHEDLRASTGFELDIPSECPVTAAPTPAEIELIRELDPHRLYTSSV